MYLLLKNRAVKIFLKVPTKKKKNEEIAKKRVKWLHYVNGKSVVNWLATLLA